MPWGRINLHSRVHQSIILAGNISREKNGRKYLPPKSIRDKDSLIGGFIRCDACRKRKICCTRDAFEKDCSLCRTRGESCQYVRPPNVRRSRIPSADPAATTRPPTSSSSSTSSVATLSAAKNAEPSTCSRSEGNGDWICQLVGQSGEQDPYVLRHCEFNQANWYRGTEWAVLRIKADRESPLLFTVGCFRRPHARELLNLRDG